MGAPLGNRSQGRAHLGGRRRSGCPCTHCPPPWPIRRVRGSWSFWEGCGPASCWVLSSSGTQPVRGQAGGVRAGVLLKSLPHHTDSSLFVDSKCLSHKKMQIQAVTRRAAQVGMALSRQTGPGACLRVSGLGAPAEETVAPASTASKGLRTHTQGCPAEMPPQSPAVCGVSKWGASGGVQVRGWCLLSPASLPSAQPAPASPRRAVRGTVHTAAGGHRLPTGRL